MAYTPEYADAFSLYNDSTMFDAGRWIVVGSQTSTNNIQAGSGRGGSNRLRMDLAENGEMERIASATSSSWIFAFAFQVSSSTPGTTSSVVQLKDGASYQVELRYTTSGTMQFTRNGTVLATGTFVFSPGVWYWVEIWVSIANASGRAVLRVSGTTTDIDFTGDTQNTANAFATRYSIGAIGGAGGTGNFVYINDFIVLRGVGGTADFLGDSKVEEKLPTGAGNYTDWTPSAGSNFQNVDETPPDGDTTYNHSSTAAQKDTFAMGDLATTSGTVHFVGFSNRQRKDDAGARTARTLHRLSGTDVNGTTRSVLDSFQTEFDWYLTKPGGGSWGISDVNGVEAGYELVS